MKNFKLPAITSILILALLFNLISPRQAKANPDYGGVFVGVITVYGLIIGIPSAIIMGAVYYREWNVKKIEFSHETICFTVNPDSSVKVEAVYNFFSHAKRATIIEIIYPFPRKSWLLPPELQSLKISANNSIEDIKPRRYSRKWKFPVLFEPNIPTDIYIDYSQKSLTNKSEYILTTANNWKKPLKSADFTIRIPEKYELLKCNYPYIEAPARDGFKCYLIQKKNFKPVKNLTFSWKSAVDAE